MALQLHSMTFESPNPRGDAAFWAGVLARSPQSDVDGILLAGSNGQLGLRFAAGAPHGAERNRLHLHLSDGIRSQCDTIEACRALGGRLRGNGHVPANSYAAMADVVDDEFCVIEDGNGFLRGCGPLGEVTCAGPPPVGRFWSEALGWPLVWEQGDETAIQSPAGGTKISWSGEWSAPKVGAERQYVTLSVAAEEFDEQLNRLIRLGASRRGVDPASEATVLSDPGGMKVLLRVH